MDVVDASDDRIRSFHLKLTAEHLQSAVVHNLRPLFPHLWENTIRDIVIYQSTLLNDPLDQTRLTNSCIDVLLETRTVQQEESLIPRDYIDLTQFDDYSPGLGINLTNKTLDDTPLDSVSFVDLITDESSLNSTNESSLLLVCSDSPLSNTPILDPKTTNVSNMSKDGAVTTPNAVSTPVRFKPDILKTSPLGSGNAHPTVAHTPLMRSPDNRVDVYGDDDGQHRWARSSKAPSTMSRCPCDDCKTNPSSHSHHNSSSSHNGDRVRHQSIPTQGGHASLSILASPRASGSIDESGQQHTSATAQLGIISAIAASNNTTTGNTVPTRVSSGTSVAEKPADSKKPPVQKSSAEVDFMKAKLDSLNEAILKLSKMSKTPRKTTNLPRPGTGKQTSSPVTTTTSVPVTGNTTDLSKFGFQKASSFASNPVNVQPATAKVNANSNSLSVYNQPSTSDVNRTTTLNPGTARTISPTNPSKAGLVQERASCRYATSSSAAGPLPSAPNTVGYSGIQRMYKSPSSTLQQRFTFFANSNPSPSHLRTSSTQPHFTNFKFQLAGEFSHMASSTQHAEGAPASNWNSGIHIQPGQLAFTKPVSTNSQSLFKPVTVGQVSRQKTSPSQAAVDRPDSAPRTMASSVRPAVPTCQIAAASTSASHFSAPAAQLAMGQTFLNPALLQGAAQPEPPLPFGHAKQPIPTANLPPAFGYHPYLHVGLNSQQQHYAKAHPSSLPPKEQMFNQQQLNLKSLPQKPALRYVPQPQGSFHRPQPVVPPIMPKIKTNIGLMMQPPVQAQPAMMQQLPVRTRPAMVHTAPLAMAHQPQPPIPAQAQPAPALMSQPPAQARPAVAHHPPAQAQAPPAQVPPAQVPPAQVPPAQAPPAPVQPAMAHQPPAQAPPAQAPPAPVQPAPVQPAMARQPPAQALPAPAQPAMVHPGPPAMVDQQPQIPPAMLQQPPQAALQENPPGVMHNFDMITAEVLSMFPDVEPEYVLTKLREFQHHPSPSHLMCNHLLESVSYPKVKKPEVPKAASSEDKESSDKTDYVNDYFKITSKSQYQKVMWQLQSVFKMLSVDTIRQVFSLHFCHYAPTRVCLEEILRTNEAVRHAATRPKSVSYEQRKVNVEITTKDKRGKEVKTTIPIQVLKGRRSMMNMNSLDQELGKQIDSYEEYTKNSAVEKDLMLALSMNENEYEAEGQLIECGCCYAEVPFENMVQCLDGHLFCASCLQNYAKQAVYGQGKALLLCMTEGCDSAYPRVQLEKCLTSKDLVKYDERVQEESIQLADIEGFVKCPSCDFGALLDPGDKVFKCQKSSCMKESCRHCGEDWAEHFGKRCEEIEKKTETDLRHSYEERMSQAQIRTCHRCKTGIMKDQGCNKMTCRCGGKMCYICRKPNIDYNHFCPHARNPGQGCTVCVKCSLWTDPVEDDDRAVEELEKELKAEKEKMNQAKDSHIPIDLVVPEAKKQRVV